jgi:hypothetical protein
MTKQEIKKILNNALKGKTSATDLLKAIDLADAEIIMWKKFKKQCSTLLKNKQ